MKTFIIILTLIVGLNISHAETGERFNLLQEVGERIKHEERKQNPDSIKLNILRNIKNELTNGIEAVYNSMGRRGDPWANDVFTKQNADAIRNILPQDDFFNATTVPPIGSAVSSTQPGVAKVGLLAIFGTIILMIFSALGIKKLWKS